MIVALGGAAIGGLVLAKNLADDAKIAVVSVTPYNPDFAGTRGALNVMMARGDGQGMAILARDPLLRRSPIDPAETVYRAQRPFVSIIAWAVSLGDPERVPLGIAVSGILGAAAGAAGSGALLKKRGVSPYWGIVVGVLPGAIASVPNGGLETWGLGFAFFGLALWPERRWTAAAAFALAGLCRETYLLVPAALVLWELLRRRVRLELALPWLVYGTWIVVLHAWAGAWPWDVRLGASLPFAGFVKAFGWGDETLPNSVVVILFGILLVPALRKPGLLRAVVLAYAALAVVMGDPVWARWEYFSRPLLPAFASGLVALLSDWKATARPQMAPG